jgi:RNA polymerase sigma factor (sigma-70 family)
MWPAPIQEPATPYVTSLSTVILSTNRLRHFFQKSSRWWRLNIILTFKHVDLHYVMHSRGSEPNIIERTFPMLRITNRSLRVQKMNSVAEFIPTRHSLLSRLKNSEDHESWRVFFDTYWKLIYTAARKAGLTDSEAQDVVQETVISVFRSMPGFKYRAVGGSFKGWLLRLTGWRIMDQFRKRQRALALLHQRSDDSSTGTSVISRMADPAGMALEWQWDEEWEANLLEAAIERVKRKVDSSHYQIFDLYVLKKWPVLKVARILKVNPGKVYLMKHRIGNLIRKEINYLRSKPI